VTRLFLIAACVAASAALAMPAGAAAPGGSASKRSCKNKREDKGCKLPVGAHYTAESKNGDRISDLGVHTSFSSVQSYVTSGPPSCGQQTTPPFSSVDIKKRLKVGKTYKGTLKEDIYPGFRRDDVSVTVKIKSAKKAKLTVKGTLFFTDDGANYNCSVNFKGTAKRSS
jgi:hypothetical protein